MPRMAHITPPIVPQIRLYQNWLRDQRGLKFESYDALWQWSVDDLPAFWQSIWDYFELQSPAPYTAVLVEGGDTVVGANSVIGASVSLTKSVPPNTQVTIDKPSLKFREAS